MAWVAVGLVDCPGPEVITLDDDEDEDTAQGPGMTPEERPFEWNCALCVKTRPKKYPRLRFSSMESFKCHLRRFCHICSSEFTSKEVCQKHFYGEHCEGKDDDGIEEMRFKFFGLDPVSKDKVEPCYFFCNSCNKLAKTFVDFMGHTKSCLGKFSCYEDETGLDLLQCFACSEVIGKSVTDLYLHFKDCTKAVVRDSYRVSIQVRQVRKFIFDELNLVISATGPQKNCGIISPVLLPTANGLSSNHHRDGKSQTKTVVHHPEKKSVSNRLIFPTFLNLKDNKLRFLDDNIDYLKKVLTRESKVVLQRRINHRKKTVKIIEISLPDEDPTESWPLPAGVSISTLDLSVDPDPCVALIDVQPRPDFNSQSNLRLLGSTTSGWVVAYTSERSDEIINVDGSFDPTCDNDDNLNSDPKIFFKIRNRGRTLVDDRFPFASSDPISHQFDNVLNLDGVSELPNKRGFADAKSHDKNDDLNVEPENFISRPAKRNFSRVLKQNFCNIMDVDGVQSDENICLNASHAKRQRTNFSEAKSSTQPEEGDAENFNFHGFSDKFQENQDRDSNNETSKKFNFQEPQKLISIKSLILNEKVCSDPTEPFQTIGVSNHHWMIVSNTDKNFVGFNTTSARKPSSHNVADIKTPETRSRSRARKFQPMALPPILTQGASSRVTCKSDATDRHDVTQVVTGKRKTDVDEKWVETSNEENTKIRVKPEEGFGSDKVHFVKLEFGIGQTERFNSGKRQTDSFRKPVVGFSDSGWAVLCEKQPFVSSINLDGAFEFCPETTWENDNPQPASNLNPGATYTLYKDKEENSEDCYMEYEEPSFLPILNLDGAFELSDNEEENNAEAPRENIENRSEQNDESGAQEIYFKDELEDQEDEDDEVQPIDHLEIGMPATYSSISSNASGIGRIMKTNAPQTPQRCSDCADEDRWFNTRDALLAHDVFFHGKDYCAPCDLFFPITSELDQHKGVLHNQFTCDQCGDCIDGKEKYTRHYLESHKILHCLLCSYSFTSENIEVHMVQGHRIPEWDMFSCGRMLDDKFTIIFDETKLTAKCNLCYRKFTREKIYNHLRYFHHSSTHQVVGLLQAAKFNLDPERSTQLQDVVTQEPKTSEIRPNPIFIEFEGRNGFCLIPQAQYICPMDSCATKNEVKLDAGLHMLLDHQMCFCHICGGFFVERRHLIRHHELLHLSDEKNTCTACHTQETFPDNFAFTIHMQDFHGTYLCCFCENLLFDSSLDLLSHMKQYHDMWQDREDAQETFYEQVLTSTLITINQNGGRIDCQMCSINFDTADLKNSENFRRHLSKFHSIRHLEKFMAMFDNQSGTFSVENLDLQNKHVPLNRNFNVEAKMSTSNATNFVERNLDEDSETEEEEEPLMKKRKRGPRKIVSKDEDHEKEKDDQIGEPVDPEGTSDTNPSEIKDEAEDDSDTEFPQSKEGESYQCEFCTTTTLSKASMRRHCLNSHALSPGYFRKDICHACNHCDAMFWSVADKVQHIAQSHSAIQGSLEKCFVCFHISPNKHALRRHFKRMHPEEKLFENVSYKCPYCGALFDLQRKMYDHIRDEHPDRSNHPCRQCDKKFTKFSSWKKHQEFHKQESIQHTCNSCGLTFETRKKYSWHVKNCDQTKKEPKLNFKCKLCEEKFADRDEREIHYKQVHPNVPMYPCNECGAKFNTKSARWSHGFSHKADDTFKCEHCGKTFNRRDTFREHLLIHTGPRYRCTHCPKEFVQRSNLRRHIRIHLGIKPYNCKFCPLTFSDKGACNSHMKIHTGDNKAKCTFCGQEFSKGQKLRYHMRLHTGEGLLTCDLCQKVFTNSYSLKTHLKRVHARIQERFPCYFCDRPGYVGNSRKSLKSHLEKVHPEAPKRCHMCMQEFSSSIEVNVHMMNVHFPEENGTKKSDDGGYQCRHCDANFPGLSDIKRHLTENHDVKSGMSMHYLNRYMNEVNFPTMTAEAPQFSVVLVAAEPELSSKAKKKEAARLKKLERQEQKEEQQLLKLQQRLEREQLRQDRELEKEQQRALKNQLKLRTKVRKPANPRKIVPNPIEDLDPMIDPETGVKLEPEDDDDDDLPYPGDFLQRVKSCIKEDEQNDYPEPDNNPLEPIIDVKIKDEPDQDYS